MSQPQNVTTNIKVANNDLEILKKHFPQCFDKDGKFELEKFKQILSNKEVSFSNESYGLDWLGKSYARLLASDAATTLLKPDEEHNQKEENTNSRNLLIKGDNLEVLKHLTGAYYEQIKMIYIDPPYNTGGDGFLYHDDRKFTVKELQQLAGVDEEKAKRILAFTQSKSNSHSAWLTFMYPRLYIAKQLLRDDGLIFVSIDENEVAQLRLLLDEIFGEENFVTDFLWKKKGTTSNVEGAQVSSLVDSTLCFKKSEKGLIKPRITPKESRSYPFSDAEGNYRETIIEKKDTGSYKRDTMKFDIIGRKPRSGKRWQIGLDTATDLERKNRFVWDGEKVKLKIYNYEDKDTSSARPNLLLEFGTTDSAASDLENYFGVQEIFDNSKPKELIQELVTFSTSENDIILDFFAGSGTTGDAVMQLNSDGFNRNYILVQLPEAIDPKKNKEAYDFIKNELNLEPTIFEITKERLTRAAGVIKKRQAKEAKLKAQDLGFKIFETMPIWDDYEIEADELNKQMVLFDETKLTKDDLKALLVTWKTYDGVPLTQELEAINLGGYTAYYGNGKLYLIDKGFITENLKTLLEKIDSDRDFDPKSVIAFGYHFDSKNLRELSENLKSYSNKKSIDIDFITRY